MSVLIRIDSYLRRTGLPVTKFGRLAVNDPRLVRDLQRGRQPRAAMMRRIEAFLAREPERRPEPEATRRDGDGR